MTSIAEPDALQIARMLGDPVRFAIYRHLLKAKELRSGDICLATPVRASTVSHHLKALSHAGLVESRRLGQRVFYRVVPETLEAYLKYLRSLKDVEETP